MKRIWWLVCLIPLLLIKSAQPSSYGSSSLVWTGVKSHYSKRFPVSCSVCCPSRAHRGQLQGQHRTVNTYHFYFSAHCRLSDQPEGSSWLLPCPTTHCIIPVCTASFQRFRKVCTNADVLIILFLLSAQPQANLVTTLLVFLLTKWRSRSITWPWKNAHPVGSKFTNSLLSMAKFTHNDMGHYVGTYAKRCAWKGTENISAYF